jgi:hypothetical protein
MVVSPPTTLLQRPVRISLLSVNQQVEDSDLQIGGTPHAAYDASTCDPYNFFSAQTLVLNVNLCGMSFLLLLLLIITHTDGTRRASGADI